MCPGVTSAELAGRGVSSAQICRDLEWTVGTRIRREADEHWAAVEATITAIGDVYVLARVHYADDLVAESVLPLVVGVWRKVR